MESDRVDLGDRGSTRACLVMLASNITQALSSRSFKAAQCAHITVHARLRFAAPGVWAWDFLERRKGACERGRG